MILRLMLDIGPKFMKHTLPLETVCMKCQNLCLEKIREVLQIPSSEIFTQLSAGLAYLFDVVIVKCVCIWRTSVFFQFYGVLSGIYNYSPPTFFYYSKSHFCSRELCYW